MAKIKLQNLSSLKFYCSVFFVVFYILEIVKSIWKLTYFKPKLEKEISRKQKRNIVVDHLPH